MVSSLQLGNRDHEIANSDGSRIVTNLTPNTIVVTPDLTGSLGDSTTATSNPGKSLLNAPDLVKKPQLAALMDSPSQSLIPTHVAHIDYQSPMVETQSPIYSAQPIAISLQIDSLIPSTSTPTIAEPLSLFIPSFGAWSKSLLIGSDLKDLIRHD